jgi:replication factor C large subunit
MAPWVHRYAPKRAADILGAKDAIAIITKHLTHYTPGSPAILLAGPPGSGKTSMVHALAHDLDIELLEVNASDHRNKDAIESIIGMAAGQQSLFFRKKAILIDEVDGVSGREDRGGISAIMAILPASRHPIILTCNDLSSDKLKPLRKACTVIELPAIAHEDTLRALTAIAQTEGVPVGSEELSAISRRSGGDLRAAINDLQSLFHGARITKADVEALSEREAKTAMQDALVRVFKTTSAEMALPAFDDVDAEPDEILAWIDENLAKEYPHPHDLARAYEALAEADRFLGRIRRWQYYRYYVYIYNLLSAGIAVAKDKKSPGVTQYKQSSRGLRIWMANQKHAKRKALAELLAPHLHTSKRRVTQDVLPYVRAMARNPQLRKQLIAQYGIDSETVTWFEK